MKNVVQPDNIKEVIYEMNQDLEKIKTELDYLQNMFTKLLLYKTMLENIIKKEK